MTGARHMSTSSDVDVDEGGRPSPERDPGTIVSVGRPAARPYTQRERVLTALRRAGARGVDATQFLLPNVIDGGPAITRLASRIDELRSRGHHIEHAGRRKRMVIYRLASLPAPVVQAPSIDDDPAALFGAAVGAAPPRSALAPEAA